MEDYKYTFTRHEVCDFSLAILGIIFEIQDEMKDPATTEERRRICAASIENRWRPLHDKLAAMLDEETRLYIES